MRYLLAYKILCFMSATKVTPISVLLKFTGNTQFFGGCNQYGGFTGETSPLSTKVFFLFCVVHLEPDPQQSNRRWIAPKDLPKA